jgi:pyruvate, water dikinase
MDNLIFISFFKNISINDTQKVGGKNSSLGEMYNNLADKDIRVPNGFALTCEAYRYFIRHNNLENQITFHLDKLKVNNNNENIKNVGQDIRTLIKEAEFPSNLVNEIRESYKILSVQYRTNNLDVAIRSSANAEDLPDASFAGQQETYLNVKGIENVILSIKNCYASLFTNRVISYRISKKFDHTKVYMSVGVQKMVRSDLGSAGVAFSLDTESGNQNIVLINSSYGLGEMVVSGQVKPDEFIVHKDRLKNGYRAIIDKKLGNKNEKLVYSEKGGQRLEKQIVNEIDKVKYSLDEEQIIELSKYVLIIEEYYTKMRNKYCPVDVEFALDGNDNKIYIVQARSETIHSAKKEPNYITKYLINNQSKEIIIKGVAVGTKIGSGKSNILHDIETSMENNLFKKGQILVTDMTDPDWEPLMKISSGIVTNRGGRTCHAAIIARELGIPAIVGTINGTTTIYNNKDITVSCGEGETGYVYQGKIDFEIKKTKISSNNNKLNTQLMMNIGNPENCFQSSMIPNEGVGLVRMEFIINNYIKVHPKALLAYSNNPNFKKENPTIYKKIQKVLVDKNYRGDQYFIDKLSNGIGRIAGAFYPKDVTVRFSDFKSNEYRNLLGGELYEPIEENPMIGWRGASRYYSEDYKKAFELECIALKKVREEMGFDNIILMIPFCRTVDECKKVLATMKEFGLERGVNGLKVYLMCEIPSNIILAEEFLQYVDGYSIGTNDLTQLTLGLDRDSGLVSHIYNERNPAVKKMIEIVIEKCKKMGKKISVCGQAPSDFPDFAKFLVTHGVDCISLIPDTITPLREFLLQECKD